NSGAGTTAPGRAGGRAHAVARVSSRNPVRDLLATGGPAQITAPVCRLTSRSLHASRPPFGRPRLDRPQRPRVGPRRSAALRVYGSVRSRRARVGNQVPHSAASGQPPVLHAPAVGAAPPRRLAVR